MKFLEQLLETLSGSIGVELPTTVGAVILIIIGWIIARILRAATLKLLSRTKIDHKLGGDKVRLSQFISRLVFLLVMAFTFMIALEKLGMESVLDPIKNVLNEFLLFLPNLIGAGLVGYIGYILANTVADLVKISAGGLKNLALKNGVNPDWDIPGLLGRIVFILLFVPLLIAAFNILGLESISEPATKVLNSVFDAIPRILVALVILILFFFGGRFISKNLEELLKKAKLDQIIRQMGVEHMFGNTQIASFLSSIVFYFIMIMGLLTAVEKLEFAQITQILQSITAVSGKILYGLVIVLIGNWISILVYKGVSKNQASALFAAILRSVVLAIFLAIGLQAMGMADEIIQMAFGIILGTVAITIILSFGLGGRVAAGKQMEQILKKLNGE